MSYHIIQIDSPSVRLTCRNGQLICKTDKGENSLPMEDIAGSSGFFMVRGSGDHKKIRC